MKLLNVPRHPFVGLALAAAVGIVFADYFLIPRFALISIAIVAAISGFALLRWPSLVFTYLLVGFSFFLLHAFQTTDTHGSLLASRLGDRPRTIGATGYVTSETHIA